MDGLDGVIHQPARLRIMAVLHALPRGERVEFTRLRGILKMTDGNIGAHLATLEGAGYVLIEKDFVGKKPRTRISLTREGRSGFERHVAALQDIVSGGEVEAG